MQIEHLNPVYVGPLLFLASSLSVTLVSGMGWLKAFIGMTK